MFADLHCDTLTRACDEGVKLRENNLHLDLIRRKSAGGGIQNFAIFLDAGKLHKREEDLFEKGKKYLEFYEKELLENADIAMPARNRKDIEECLKTGKTACILTLEEGAICKGNFDNLRFFYERGVRMMTLTWNYDNELAASCTTKEDCGLTKKGKEFVEEMERLGIIVDVSHLSDKGIYEIADMTRKPFVASHSNARAICPHRRNLTDEMIRLIAKKDGVIGLNFYENFLCADYRKMDAIEQRKVLAAHVKHILNVGGEDCIAIGSDFDGIDTNPLLPEVTVILKIRDWLHTEGISERVLDKMYLGNVTRLYKGM